MKRLSFFSMMAALLFLAGCNSEEPQASLQSISLSKSNLEIETGSTVRLSVIYSPEEAEDNAPEILWESSRSKIARVDDKGRVTGVATGTATITAYCGKLSASCEVTVVKPAPVTVKVTPASITVPQKGGEYTVQITTNHEWTAAVSESWVTLDADKGIGNSSLKLNVAPNETFETTTAQVEVKAGTEKAIVSISREGRTPESISLSPATIEFPAEGGTQTVKVLTSIAWTATVQDSWITVSPASGEGDGTITIICDAASAMSQIKQQVTFSNGQTKETLSVTRAGRAPKPITLNYETLNFNVNGGSYIVTVKSDIEWNVESSASWVQIKDKTAGSVKLEVGKWENSHSGAVVTFSNGESTAAITVTQAVPELTLSYSNVYAPAEGGSYEITLTYNFDWYISNNTASWVDVSPGYGNGFSKITVKVKEAETSVTSQATFSVVCGNITRVVTVYRAGYDPKSFTINNSGTEVYFSPSNLYYTASAGKWSFAQYQYNYQGSLNTHISSTNSSAIDLFGRGTSGYNNKYPYNYSNNSSLYCLAATEKYMINTNYDWGHYNNIYYYSSSNYDPAGTWRIMTDYEWEYLLNTRKVSGLSYALCTVRGTKGLILFPDHFENPGVTVKSSSSNFSTNTFSEADWNKLENAGAVFLPAAGQREEKTMNGAGNAGYYWMGGGVNESSYYYGYILMFSESGVQNRVKCEAYKGCAVRLVKVKTGQG